MQLPAHTMFSCVFLLLNILNLIFASAKSLILSNNGEMQFCGSNIHPKRRERFITAGKKTRGDYTSANMFEMNGHSCKEVNFDSDNVMFHNSEIKDLWNLQY